MLPLLAAIALAPQKPAAVSPWEREVIYQIFPRSFRDSNGDRIGDFRGIAERLDHIKGLGATTILINPIQMSRMYHNYFADDFYRTDPEFGTNKEFFDLVKQAHRRRIKVLLDMEVQYVADQHPWYVARQKDPASPYAAYLWDDKGFYTSVPLPMYDGTKIQAAAVDPTNPNVQTYMRDLFRYWAAPEGRKADGVDGFRIDHMMDDLDHQGKKTGMLENFWKPIEQDLRRLKPSIFFLGEQSDWGLGAELFEKGDVDANYAMPLAGAILSRDRAKIEKAATETISTTPPGKTHLLFIENHDLQRYATFVESNPNLLRLGAVLSMTMKGTPLMYYGQELGMLGKPGSWNSDGNDIPIRLAYRWIKNPSGAGIADWYRDTGPWSDVAKTTEVEGISVEEQDKDPRSLLNFYRRLIALRKSSAALREGSMRFVDLGDPKVLAFVRETPASTVYVIANLRESSLNVALPTGVRLWKDLWFDTRVLDVDPSALIELPAQGFRIIEVRGRRP
jgi:glycosidase